VFAGLAGPAISLRLRTEALHQALNRFGPLGTTFQVAASWNTFTEAYTGQPVLNEDDLSSATADIGIGLANSVPIAPGSWGGLTTALHNVTSGTARSGAGYQPVLEVIYRDEPPVDVQTIAGRVTTIPGDAIGVTVTQQTAARYGLHAGSRLVLKGPDGPVRLQVTAIVRERDPAATFWTADPLATAPDLVQNLSSGQLTLEGAVLANRGQLAAVESAFCPVLNVTCDNMQLDWTFPVDLSGVTADQAQAFVNDLATATDSIYASTLQSVAPLLAISEPMTSTLTAFISAQAAVLAVLLLLFASLTVIVVLVILLAARMVVGRRDDELVVLRHRGASSRQIAMRVLAGVIPPVVPAAAAGFALVWAFIPGTSLASGWKQAAALLAIALAAPPLIAVWRYRRPVAAINPALILTPETGTRRASVAAQRRLVAGLTLCAGAVAGLVVLRGQGVSAAGVTNWYLTIAPVLVAIPAALIAMRLYPLAIRALLPVWRRRRGGVAGYVGLAGAIERRTATALPAFTLVLALTLAAFGGMVNGSIADGQVNYSWQTSGADAVINTNGTAYDLTPQVQRSIAAVPGVRHSTAVWTTAWQTSLGQHQLNVAAVDPAGYAALTADTPFPGVPVSAFGPAARGPVTAATVIPVVASPAAAAVLGTGVVQISSQSLIGPVRIRVAGVVARTPAEPGGGLFVLMPLRTLPGALGRPAPNLGLVTGAHIDRAALSRVVSKDLPPATLSFRSDVLRGLGSAPLQHAAALLMTLTAVTGAGLALLNLIFGLALGARDRELTLARLTVMGYDRDTRLVLLMALPAVLAAFAAALGCALALPALISPALDLSVFTGPGASVSYRPDVTALALPGAAIAVLIGVTLTIQTIRARHRTVTGLLRVQ
jgi:putative ABC transport system permease protein